MQPLTSLDLLVWEINKLYPIYLHGILANNTAPLVITMIPYLFLDITNTYSRL